MTEGNQNSPNRCEAMAACPADGLVHSGPPPAPAPGAHWQFIRFCIVGGINTVSALALIWLLMAAGVGKYAANLAGYALGLCISFVLNRNWTFRRSGGLDLPELGRFVLAFAVAYLCNLAVVAACFNLGLNAYLAQAAGLPAYTLSFYFLSSRFVFPVKSRGP